MTSISSLRLTLHPLRRPPLQRQFHRSHVWRQPHTVGRQGQSRTVKIYKRLFSAQKLFYTATTTLFLYWGMGKLFGGVEIEILEEEEEATEEQVDEDGNVLKDEDSSFIAFQYPRRLKQTYYKGSDPDWQEFAKFSNDSDRKRAVTHELAKIALFEIAGHPAMKRQLGKDIRLTRCWLDIKYPDGPPPEYWRRGLEFRPDVIAWSTQIIPQSQYLQIRHILWPRALFGATTQSLATFLRLKVLQFKSTFGLPLNGVDQKLQQLCLAVEHKRRREKAKQEADEIDVQQTNPHATIHTSTDPVIAAVPTPTPAVEELPSASDAARPSITTAVAKVTSLRKTDRKPPDGIEIPVLGLTLPILAVPIPVDLAVAGRVFLIEFVRKWQQSKHEVQPPGCLFLFGHVEARGSKGRCKVDVMSAYDPKAAQFKYVNCAVKHIWQLEGSPKGGP